MNDTDLSTSLTRRTLPDGWAWSTVAGVGDVNLGRQRSPKNRSADYPTKYIRAANLTWNGVDLSEVLEMDFKPAERAVYRLKVGDVLLSEASGSSDQVGKPAVWGLADEEYCFQNTVIRFRPREVLPEFAQVIFTHYARNGIFGRVAVGIGIQHLGADRLSAMPFAVPPLDEQRRIVAKIDELFSDLDAAVSTLERVKAKLKRYRASVLKAAIEGKLTAEWRSKHPVAEPAAPLLERILVERRRRWEDAQRTRFAAAAKTPPKGWETKYPAPNAIDSAGLPVLPDRWCWARVLQVGDVQLGRQRSPEHHTGEYMRPYLRVANVFENRIDTDDVLQMNFTPEEFETFRLLHGDILLNEGQSLHLVGRPAMYRDEVPGACFQNTLVRFRAVPGLVPEFALYVFLAYLHNKRFQKIARWTVNIAHLGSDRFSQIEFPLPPAEEQAEIVREIEARLTVVDQVTAQVDANLKRAERLRQGILKRAFEGKLVPQVATDEPATVLLERIRQQRLDAPQTPARKPVGGKLVRAVLENVGRAIAYCLSRAKRPHGRTWLAKVLAIGELHVGIPFKQRHGKYPHGPFDDMIYKAERVARKAGWFDFTEQAKAKEQTSYVVTAGTPAAAAVSAEFLGDCKGKFDELLDYAAEVAGAVRRTHPVATADRPVLRPGGEGERPVLRRQASPGEGVDDKAVGVRPADEQAFHAEDEPAEAGRPGGVRRGLSARQEAPAEADVGRGEPAGPVAVVHLRGVSQAGQVEPGPVLAEGRDTGGF